MKGDTMYSWMKGDKCTAGCNQTMHRYTNIQVQVTDMQCMITIYRCTVHKYTVYDVQYTDYRLQCTTTESLSRALTRCPKLIRCAPVDVKLYVITSGVYAPRELCLWVAWFVSLRNSNMSVYLVSVGCRSMERLRETNRTANTWCDLILFDVSI